MSDNAAFFGFFFHFLKLANFLVLRQFSGIVHAFEGFSDKLSITRQVRDEKAPHRKSI